MHANFKLKIDPKMRTLKNLGKILKKKSGNPVLNFSKASHFYDDLLLITSGNDLILGCVNFIFSNIREAFLILVFKPTTI